MRFFEDKNYRIIAIVISIPLLLVAQYYFFKIGILKPMVKGVEMQIVDGDYIKDLDKFVIKLNEPVTVSRGDYITIPSYSKTPTISFKELDDSNILKIEGSNITGVKEGVCSVGIMKDSRVLKKINIKVVKQKVIDLRADYINDIRYVGDSTEVESFVEVEYNKFSEKERVEYESSNPSVLKVYNDNTVEAVGVGTAYIIAKSGDKEYNLKEYNVQAKIAKIEIPKEIEIGVGKSKKLNPRIITSPKNLKYGKIRYELTDNKLPIERAITLYKDGTVIGLKEGIETVKITCGNKSTTVKIKVIGENAKPDININLIESHEVVGDKLIINLEWDYIDDILDYGIYLKNNSLEEIEFNLFKAISVKKDEISKSKKVNATIELDLIDGKIPNISLYVVGKTDTGDTEPSNTVTIRPESENNIENEIVKNLQAILDESNNSIKLTWSPIDMPDVTYSIYVMEKSKGETGFKLYQNGIQGNEFSILLDDEIVDIDIYVKANKDGKDSKQSDTINIQK